MRSNIVEKTEAEAIVQKTRDFFRPVSAQTPVIPASYDGKFAMIAVIATDVEPDEGQMDAFETSVEAITGVHKAFILIGPARIPIDRVPVDCDLRIRAEAGFLIDPTPEPEE